MVETRPAMSVEDFERLAAHREPKWWATGEGLIYQPDVMSLPQWRKYGSPDNLKLTEAQRCLMMWGDIVGQVQNGGLEQFFENYDDQLELAEACVAQLAWPELSDRFGSAFAEFIHINGSDASLKQWRAHRIKERERYRDEARKILAKRAGKKFEGDVAQLDWFVTAFAVQGDIKIQGWDYPHVEEFSAWFCAEPTKAESSRRIASFASDHRDELVRIV